MTTTDQAALNDESTPSGVNPTSSHLSATMDPSFNLVADTRIGTLMYRLEGDDLIFVSSNGAASEILGVDCTQFIGQTIEQAFPPLADTEVPAMYRRAARDGIPWSTEHISYDDAQIHGAYEVHAFQVAPMNMAALFVDVTQRKQSEMERSQLANQIQHTQRLESLGVLAGGIAHGFQQPALRYPRQCRSDPDGIGRRTSGPRRRQHHP